MNRIRFIMTAGRLTLCLAILSTVLYSCAGAVRESMSVNGGTVVTPEPVDPYAGDDRQVAGAPSAEIGTGSQFSGFDITETGIDPLTTIRILWENGDSATARNLFWSPQIRSLADGSRRSEWSLWRSRLYITRWPAHDLGLAEENISALLPDRDDVWGGTWTGGLVRHSVPLAVSDIWDPGRPSLAVRTVNRIRRYGRTIWVVRYGAVERYDTRTADWTADAGLPVAERLQDILVRDDSVYLGTLGKGLWVREQGSWRILNTPGLFINRIEPGPGSGILISTMDRGIFLYYPSDGSWLRPPDSPLSDMNVTSATFAGNLVAGGTYGSGAFSWNLDTGEIRFFGTDVLGDPWVLSAAASGQWIHFGTFGAGIRSMNTVNQTWESLEIEDGMPSADVGSLAVDDRGDLWAGTLGGGIIRITDGIYGD